MRIPILPIAPSWYPGHMFSFMNKLPVLLSRTDIVLELRDSRLPLTSVNPNFEREITNWRATAEAPSDANKSPGKQRIIVMNKCDLVPKWGIEVSISILIFQPALSLQLSRTEKLFHLSTRVLQFNSYHVWIAIL
jgi:ribosome biogenesis GTPase A